MLRNFSIKFDFFSEQNINKNNNDDKSFNSNAIINANFKKISRFLQIGTRRPIQNFDYFNRFRMSFLTVADEIDYFNFRKAELRLFFRDNFFCALNVSKNRIKILNMFHDRSTNIEQNFFIVVSSLRAFYI